MAGTEKTKEAESKPVDKQELLKNLKATEVEMKTLVPSRESSLALSGLKNAIYWLELSK